MLTASFRKNSFACLLVAALVPLFLPGCDPGGKGSAGGKIDRYALVHRHNVVVTRFDSMASVSVGNGNFAFTVDPTGLQSFPDFYAHGVSLGTESSWGWHSFPNPNHYTLADVTRDYLVHGREVPYVTSFSAPARKKQATAWLRENPHRLDLGRIGWELRTASGSAAPMDSISRIHQVLDLWTGEITSRFSLGGEAAEVKTVCSPRTGMIAVRAASPLLGQGRMNMTIRFAYGSGQWGDACDWNSPARHQTLLVKSQPHAVLLKRILDTTVYYVQLAWQGDATFRQLATHRFELVPAKGDSVLSFSCAFSPAPPDSVNAGFAGTQAAAKTSWEHFWKTGGAVDLSGSTDPRAFELERRIVLSEYLTRIQCAGMYPPQETGLTYNSWYGKFHLEMHFWHEAHFALWDRTPLLERSLSWYKTIAPRAAATARKQGYEGYRWPKMTDPTGRESPSPIGPFLIWQEPHIIYMSELCYRSHPGRSTLEKYKDLVFGTADFMASYPWYDSLTGKYVLGPALIPAQERYNRDSTINPTFELAYWYWGLSVAQKWRERLGLPKDPRWQRVMDHLSPLPVKNGVYLAAQSAPDTYTNPRFTTDHPSMLMAYGFLPRTPLLDTAVMRATWKKVMQVWDWPGTWGWDYPMMAMTATRLGMPEEAIRVLLMKVTKNTYLPDGHNYQRANLRCYLPGNGSLLLAISMMCAGWDGYQGPPDPGFPKNGKWKVRWEDLRPMP
jgi:hypothetical protein